MDRMFEDAIENHKKLWNYMAKTGSRWKEEYFRVEGIEWEDWPKNECFACEYAFRKYKDTKGRSILGISCEYCPVKFVVDETEIVSYYCEDKQSLYEKWSGEQDVEERKKLAKMIADLPPRYKK